MGKNVVVKDIMEKNGEKCFLGKNVAGKNVVGKNVFGENCLAPESNIIIQGIQDVIRYPKLFSSTRMIVVQCATLDYT